MELVDDALEKRLLFSDVVFDNWYFANSFISFLEERNLCWITEADSDRQISYHGKWVRASLSDGDVIKKYALRWKIECMLVGT